MADREKVIEELKELCEYLFHEYKVCFHGDEEDTYNRFLSANNALELLKEREAVSPIYENYWKHTMGRCGHCKAPLPALEGMQSKFCWMCGRKVKWDA